MIKGPISMDDCFAKVAQITEYDEKIIQGKIIQMWYRIGSSFHGSIEEVDQKIQENAEEFGGRLTGETGIFISQERRDLDIEFPTVEKAVAFRSHILSTAELFHTYFFHSKLNIKGKLSNFPTIEQIENKKKMIQKLHCS